MKKKTILLASLLFAATASINAQTTLFSQGFEEAQSSETNPADTLGVGWYQFINTHDGDTREAQSTDDVHDGAYSCHFYNTPGYDGYPWDRAIKFRNLTIKDGTSYRLTFYTKGDNEYTSTTNTTEKSIIQAGLMCGIENGDISFMGANSTAFSTKLTDVNSNVGEWNKHVVMGYFVNYDWNNSEYIKSTHTVSATMPNKYFVTLNIYNPGDYYLDDVSLMESEIAGTAFGAHAVRVDFGYSTNLETLCKNSSTRRIIYDNSCATLKVNGTEAKILSVEAIDGKLYVFIDQSLTMKSGDVVSVSFKNPTDASKQILYTSDLRPRCDTEDKVVKDFTDDVATYEESCGEDVESSQYALPVLASADPENGSFDLPTTTKAYSMTFDKEIDCSKVSMSLYNKVTKKSISLTVAPNTGYATTIVGTAASDVPEGLYAVKANHITNEINSAGNVYLDTTITVTVGTTVIDDPDATYSTVWSEDFSTATTTYPTDWTIIENGKEMTALPFDAGDGGDSGNRPRFESFETGAAFGKGFLLHRGANASGTYYAEYGNNAKLPQKGGNYRLIFDGITWCNWGNTTTEGGLYLKAEIVNSMDKVLAQNIKCLKPNVQFAKNISGSTKDTLDVSISAADYTGGNWRIRLVPVNASGEEAGSWSSEVLVGNLNLSYQEKSMTASYKAALTAAIAEADSTLKANDSTRYAGTYYDALSASLTKYKNMAFTSPTSISTAITELSKNAKTLATHRTLCDTYDPLCDAANTVLFTYAGSKYANTPSYPLLQKVYNQYNGKVLTDNTELQTAIDSLTHYTNLCSNMCGSVIGVYTKRIDKGLVTAAALGVDAADPVYVAATNAITDDNNVAGALNDKIRAKLYANIADGTTDFSVKTRHDEALDEDIQYTDSFDMSSFIKNPQMYVTSPSGNNITEETCPGWTVDGSIGVFFTDWQNYSTHINSTKPAGDDCVLRNWCTNVVVSQNVTGIPVGVYNVKLGMSDTDGSDVAAHPAYGCIYFGADSDSIQCPNTGLDVPNGNLVFKNIKITDGKLTIKFKSSTASHLYINNAILTLVNKISDYNYATSVKGVDSSNKELKSVNYYRVDGSRLNAAAKGITIVKKTFTDGTVKIEKTLSK